MILLLFASKQHQTALRELLESEQQHVQSNLLFVLLTFSQFFFFHTAIADQNDDSPTTHDSTTILCYRYRDPCSASLNDDDNHTIKLIGNENKKAITLAKTCEQTNELRDCRAPRDWSILALQNTRTGKSHYLVICKCPNNFRLGKSLINYL